MAKNKKPVKKSRLINMKIDPIAHEIINRVRQNIEDSGFLNPNTSDVIRKLNTDSKLLADICDELMFTVGEHGENKGALELVRRLVRERDKLQHIANTAGAV